MSLKRKIALNLSVAFSLLFGIVMMVIYFSFYDFRRDEFKHRFKERLELTTRFIENAKNFEEDASLFFNENADNFLFNEKIIVFDGGKHLIYSTLKDQNIEWESHLLDDLDKEKTIYRDKTTPEIYAALRNIKGKNYYIITSADDQNGRSKLDYLKFLLITAYVFSTLLIGIFSYYFVGKFLKPLDDLNREVSKITAHQLTTQIPVEQSNDEISILANSFNTMISRLNDVFQSQKDFTASASHEIRTPITRMSFQLQNLIKLGAHSPETISSLSQIQKDVYQLSELTNSLLLLTKFDRENIQSLYEDVRIDEVIFEAFETVEKSFPKFRMDFLISETSDENAYLTVHGIAPLLNIVFINLLKNAAVYSDDMKADVVVTEEMHSMIVDVISVGKCIPEKEQVRLFDAFTRGDNSQNISGSGLGLRIVKRIIEYHGAEINYFCPNENTNNFRIIFHK